ncbi:MAG: hypothetical protein WA172_00075, partial [Terriglobales bacterium]
MAESDNSCPSTAKSLSATAAASSNEGIVPEQLPSNSAADCTHGHHPTDTLLGGLNLSDGLWRTIAIFFAIFGAAGLIALLVLPRLVIA